MFHTQFFSYMIELPHDGEKVRNNIFVRNFDIQLSIVHLLLVSTHTQNKNHVLGGGGV